MRFVIVTGMSGAGKSTALDYLEDADFYCVDNLPPALIYPFAQIAQDGKASEFTKFAVGVDIRSGLSEEKLNEVLTRLQESHIAFDILFLDASDEVLLKRYKETRRSHPLQEGKLGLREAIGKERQKIAFLKEKANYIIDTSKLLTRELKQELLRIFVEDQCFKNLIVTVQSFGFKYGVPADSDLVIDVRFIPNPYYVPELRPLTGNDEAIYDFVMAQPQSGVFLQKFTDMLDFLLPNYVNEGKNQLVISIGCTGGKHRSVVMANEIFRWLGTHCDYGVRIEHRDIERESARVQYHVEES